MTWDEISECFEIQLFQWDRPEVQEILLGPEEAAAYRAEYKDTPFAEEYSGKLKPFGGYPVKQMRCPGVAVRIEKPK